MTTARTTARTTALALLAAAALALMPAPARAHDGVGSTDFPLLVPDFPLGGSILSVLLIGPESGKEMTHVTWDITFSSPPGGTLASDLVLELHLPLSTGQVSWVVTGAALGLPAATGTFSGRLSSDEHNGVLEGGMFGFTTPELFLSATTGGIDGKFIASTITLELAADLCQASLGLGGPGAMSLAVCGEALGAGGSAEMRVQGAQAFAPLFLLAGTSLAPTPFKGGLLAPVPFAVVLPLAAGPGGSLSLSVPGGGGPLTAYVQALAPDASQPLGWALSNAVQVELLP